MTQRHFLPENPCVLVSLISGLIGGVFLVFIFIRAADSPLFQTHASTTSPLQTTPIQLRAILHYATSTVVPQQTIDEITISFDILRSLSPCNFLVFGLGHDSLMWASLNPRGTTLFLEETPEWVQTTLKIVPDLNAHAVNYTTKLYESNDLLSSYKSEPDCFPPDKAYLKNNERCRLALNMLPDEVYDKEWDLIMIDAPRGYFDESPGRMAAIYSAAVMARKRKGSGVTHVFLHDVDRKVEKAYAEEFLCRKYLVKALGGSGTSRYHPLLKSPRWGGRVLDFANIFYQGS